MKRLCLVALACAAVLSLPALAGGGNGAPSGGHYNLNIIGVENPKTATLTGSDRHTIFVALKNSGDIGSKIYLTQGDFQVCDGNAFDAAYNCDGDQIQPLGAVFQLPCNTNIPTTIDCTGFSEAYQIWARALGSPKLIDGLPPGSTITTCATDVATQEVVCSTESAILSRNKGKQTFQNVTNQLSSLCVDTNPADGTDDCDIRYPLFNSTFQDFFWDYYNKGLRLAQLRFYVIE